MLHFLLTGAAAFNVGGRAAFNSALRGGSASMATLSDFKAQTLDGADVSMDKYKGKPVLIVNVASL
jgi:hypothetical protein